MCLSLLTENSFKLQNAADRRHCARRKTHTYHTMSQIIRKNIVVIGANRGIGLELARRFVGKGDRVYAVCRKANDEMRKSKFESIVENVDVGDDSCKATLQNSFKDVSIDILIHNSGILDVDDLDTLDLDSVRRQFEINSLGPLRVVMALKSCMKVGDSYIGLMTSQMGSIADNSSGGYYGYRMSKCALNMAGKSLALDLKGTSSVQLLHPGFVRTDMTKDFGSGARPVGESVDGIMEIIESGYGGKTDSGTFWHGNYGNGIQEIEW